MITVARLWVFYLLLHGGISSLHLYKKTNKLLNIVFVYTVVPAVCEKGLPSYILTVLNHTLTFQKDCQVILASNFEECKQINVDSKRLDGLQLVDTTLITSNRTLTYLNYSRELFSSDYRNELWLTSALRLLLLEDIMYHYRLPEMLHVEADNMLYGPISSLLPALRQHCPLAATPLTTNFGFITASVLWIQDFSSLRHLTDFFLGISQDHHAYETLGMKDTQDMQFLSVIWHMKNQWKRYLVWLRKYGCCKKNGVDAYAAKNFMGIKPYSINEMTILAYYRHLYPHKLKLIDIGHISGQVIAVHKCQPMMLCANSSTLYTSTMTSAAIAHIPISNSNGCYTAPFVRCGHNSSDFI